MTGRRPPSRWLPAAAVAGMAALAAAAPAQDKRPMTIVELVEVPRVGSPRLSPDGTELLYTRTDADWEANGRTTHIRRIRSDGTGDLRLTSGETGESSPRWSPDGAWIAFLARRGESPSSQIHRLRTSGGEASPLTEHETPVQSFAFSPDGDFVYFIAADPETAEAKKKDELGDDVFASMRTTGSGTSSASGRTATGPVRPSGSPGATIRSSASAWRTTEPGSPTHGRRPRSSTTATRARSGSWTRTGVAPCS